MSLLTGANWIVIIDNTDSIDSTRSRARISTLLVDASLADGAVTAEDTFGPARDVGVADVVLCAGAGGLTVDCDTLSIGPARVGIARISRLFWLGRWYVGFGFTEEERVPSVTFNGNK